MKLWTIGSGLALPVAGLAAFGMTHMSSPSIPQEREQAFATQIQQSQEFRRNNHPDQALRLITGIPSNSKHYAEAQTLQSALIPEVIESAKTLHRQGNIDPAIAMLQSIPAIAPGAQEAQALKVDWVKESRQIAEIQQSIQAKRFPEAVTKINRLRGRTIFDSPSVQSFLQQALNNNGEALPFLAPNGTPNVSTVTLPNVVVPQISSVMPPPPPIKSVAVNVDDAISSTNPSLVPQATQAVPPVSTIQPIPRVVAPAMVEAKPRSSQVEIATVPLLRSNQTPLPLPTETPVSAQLPTLPTKTATSAQDTLQPDRAATRTVEQAQSPSPVSAISDEIASTPVQPSITTATPLPTESVEAPVNVAQEPPAASQQIDDRADYAVSRASRSSVPVASSIPSGNASTASTPGKSISPLPTYIRANLFRLQQRSQSVAQTSTRKQAMPMDAQSIEQMLSAQTPTDLVPDASLDSNGGMESLSPNN